MFDTLLAYEYCTLTTDSESQRRFLRYWRLVRSFVGHALRATLGQIDVNAAARRPNAAEQEVPVTHDGACSETP